jgi:hypothetical protein
MSSRAVLLVASALLVTCASCAEGSGTLFSGAGAGTGGEGGDPSTSGSPAGSGGAAGAASSGGTAGAAGTGGAAGSGGSAGSTGSGGCSAGTNTDGDGMDDCTEAGDGDPWTDPAIFNGMHVRWAEQCNGAPSCPDIDTLAEVDACVASVPMVEQMDQYSGWDWTNPDDSICTPGYNFQPPWTQCSDSNAIRWQADWQGYINLTQSGQHCFAAVGASDQSCTAIYFNTETMGITDLSGYVCFDVPAGAYPIRWHYEMDNGSDSNMHVSYCFGGATPCALGLPILASMLRVSP